MSYPIRRVLAKPRLIVDEMCRLYGKFASYLRRVLHKTRLIFPRINGPSMTVLLSFEEKADDARAWGQSGHCPFNSSSLNVF